MAKDKKAQQPNVPTTQQPEKTRVTGYLSPVESALFSSLCNLFDVNSGDGIAMMVWTTYNALESGQRDAVGAMARAKTGLSRLPSGPKTQKSTPAGEEQGGHVPSTPSSPSATHSATKTSPLDEVQPSLGDTLEKRTAAISAKYAETTGVLDDALHEVATNLNRI